MRGNSWRLVWTSLLTVLPIKIATFGLTAVAIAVALPGGSEFAGTPPLGLVILAGVIEAVSDILLAALGASVLSGFYRELVAWRAVASNPDEPPAS
jgi:NADH:ubiquinone oxidoreductase subunit 4 (subunit M)